MAMAWLLPYCSDRLGAHMKSNLGISSFAVHFPDGRLSAQEIMSHHNLSSAVQKVFCRVFGLSEVATAREAEPLQTSLHEALKKLKEKAPRLSPELVIYVHGLPCQAPVGDDFVQSIIRDFFPEFSPPLIGISHHNCASLIYGIAFAEDVFAVFPKLNEILILAADQLNLLGPESRYVTGATLVGDAALAIQIMRNGPHNLLSQATRHEPKFHEGLYADDKGYKEFYSAHDDILDKVIDASLEKAALSLKQIDWILPHNTNLAVWNRFSERTGFPRNRIHTELVTRYGHCYTVDPFLSWENLEDSGKLKPGDRVLALTVGIGAYAGACIFEIGKSSPSEIFEQET